MGEKDITQKNFESYNDVVADIFNGSLFDGEESTNYQTILVSMCTKSQTGTTTN